MKLADLDSILAELAREGRITFLAPKKSSRDRGPMRTSFLVDTMEVISLEVIRQAFSTNFLKEGALGCPGMLARILCSSISSLY